MKAVTGLHVEWVDDEAVVLDSEAGTLHYLNPQASLVYALILELGFAEALKQVRDRFGTEEVSTHLDQLVEDMKEKGLLVDD